MTVWELSYKVYPAKSGQKKKFKPNVLLTFKGRVPSTEGEGCHLTSWVLVLHMAMYIK